MYHLVVVALYGSNYFKNNLSLVGYIFFAYSPTHSKRCKTRRWQRVIQQDWFWLESWPLFHYTSSLCPKVERCHRTSSVKYDR